MIFSHRRRCDTPFSLSSLLLLGSLFARSWAASDSKDKPLEPCQIRSPTTHAFFDLNKIARHEPSQEEYKKHANDPDWEVQSYHVKGYDYGANFTINFCAPVVEHIRDVEGVDEDLWRNVSAFYEMGGKTYSIGQQSSEPLFRGRKLILNYTDGSPCPGESQAFGKRQLPSAMKRPKRSKPRFSKRQEDHELHSHEASDLESARKGGSGYSLYGAEDDGDDEPWPVPSEPDEDRPKDNSTTSHDGLRRKTTTLSLLCEKDPLAKTSVSFVASPDHCSYFFEVRTLAACAGVEAKTQTGSVGPGGVFGVIAVIAILVYMIGGCVYQRTVMNQRGWRQLPNYSMWQSCFSAFSDCFVILTSSCARWLPKRRGYTRVSGVPNGYGRGRSNPSDDENRLIDQLDEEWDD